MKISMTNTIALALLSTTAVVAQEHVEQQPVSSSAERPPHPRKTQGPHGGELHQVGAYRVETQALPGGIRLFVYDSQGRPVDVRSARGLAQLKVAGDAKRYRYDLFPEVHKDKSADSLAAAVDLSRFGGRQVELGIQLVGIPGTQRRPAQFVADMVVPMTAAQSTAAAIVRQKVCPVSGQPLGSMGQPIPVTLQDRTIYVCCAGCVDAVKSEPQKYLSMNLPRRTANNGAVKKATKEDAQFVAAQRLCPVMDEPLDAMGGPYRTVVEGRVIYICCPGCAKKLHADPSFFFEKLAKQGISPPRIQ